jgi:hypothetical protein
MIFIITRATESARKTVGKLFADIRRWKFADTETFCPTVRHLRPNSFIVRSMPRSDWLAPIVVWSGVVWMMLSIVMILLGES